MTQMNFLNVWELIQNNQFEEACQKADLEYEQSKRAFSLRNKVYALMHLRKFDEVIALCMQLIERENGEADIDFIFCGIAYWGLNKVEDAVNVWQKAQNAKYTDAAGGVQLQLILFFAFLKTGNKELQKESTKKLKKLARSKAAAVNWPGALAPFILGDMSVDVLLSKVSLVTILKERQSCQAYFAIAVKELENNNIEGYKESLKKAISYGSSAYLEQLYYLAEVELKNL